MPLISLFKFIFYYLLFKLDFRARHYLIDKYLNFSQFIQRSQIKNVRFDVEFGIELKIAEDNIKR